MRVVGARIPIELEQGDLTFVDEHGHAAPAFGLYSPTYQRIVLWSEQAHERRKNTLVHEAIHAMVNAAHIQMDNDDEEMLAGRLSPILLDFLRSNRGLILYLQEDLP